MSKKSEAAKVGVIGTILAIIREKGPITKDKIVDELGKRLPEKDKEKMAKTVRAQIGGKSPTRMEKEKKVTFAITEEGFKVKKG